MAKVRANPKVRANLDGINLDFKKPDAPFVLHLIVFLPSVCAVFGIFIEVCTFILFGKCHRHLKAYAYANEAYHKLIERDGQLLKV
ncbi:hypothetical protein L596_022399 [Steinernema carpocapsae]|uniref:Uncharacterized protein n=1 Tax=Steinernema carpocapsae TaxID=34508 RepID=A0A4U5MLZ6_STECR|nr:hypothetical protein L596_022399 [Steinernema carpocapsae]